MSPFPIQPQNTLSIDILFWIVEDDCPSFIQCWASALTCLVRRFLTDSILYPNALRSANAENRFSRRFFCVADELTALGRRPGCAVVFRDDGIQFGFPVGVFSLFHFMSHRVFCGCFLVVSWAFLWLFLGFLIGVSSGLFSCVAYRINGLCPRFEMAVRVPERT